MCPEPSHVDYGGPKRLWKGKGLCLPRAKVFSPWTSLNPRHPDGPWMNIDIAQENHENSTLGIKNASL